MIASETSGGKYVTVVTCSGGATPPPIKLGAPGTPLTASGTGPSAGLSAMLSKPNPYKTVYTCSVTVEEKTIPAKPEAKAAVRKTKCELGGQRSERRRRRQHGGGLPQGRHAEHRVRRHGQAGGGPPPGSLTAHRSPGLAVAGSGQPGRRPPAPPSISQPKRSSGTIEA